MDSIGLSTPVIFKLRHYQIFRCPGGWDNRVVYDAVDRDRR